MKGSNTMTDNNSNKITQDNLPPVMYSIVRLCIDCMKKDSDACIATPFPQAFPSMPAARGFLEGMIEGMVQDGEISYNSDTHIVTLVDDDGETHNYVSAITRVEMTVVWNLGQDKETDQTFNDIVKNFDIE